MNYDYKCENCNKVITVECRLKDYQSEIVCPYCNNNMHRFYGNSHVNCNTYFDGSYNSNNKKII